MIQCEQCTAWFHSRCAGLTGVQFNRLKKAKQRLFTVANAQVGSILIATRPPYVD